MFSNLANYLLGSFSYNQQETEEAVENLSNIRLKTVRNDEDWVLVDHDSDSNSEHGSEESDPDNATKECDKRLSRTSSTSSLVRYANSMDESWFLTPPPCFISSGPIHMETSPLENLLIEHPSMSVYHQHQPVLGLRRHGVSLESLEVEEEVFVEEAVVEEVEVDDFLEVVQTVPPQQPRRNRAEEINQQEKQGIKTKQAQKVQIQKACQSLKRGYLDRNNKAREVNCRNQRLRRGERSQGATRSHANNNRKC